MKFNNIEKKYEGKFINLYNAKYTTELGNEKIYELISRRKDLSNENFGVEIKTNAVALLIFNDDESKVLMTREFRMACNKVVYNLPAGLIDPGETPQEAAKRELKEETGLDLYEINDYLPPAYTVVGFSDELVATIIGKAKGEFHESTSDFEEIEPVWISKNEARELIKENANMSLRPQTLLWLWSRK